MWLFSVIARTHKKKRITDSETREEKLTVSAQLAVGCRCLISFSNRPQSTNPRWSRPSCRNKRQRTFSSFFLSRTTLHMEQVEEQEVAWLRCRRRPCEASTRKQNVGVAFARPELPFFVVVVKKLTKKRARGIWKPAVAKKNEPIWSRSWIADDG